MTIMSFEDIKSCPPESTVYVETKQTLRPAFFHGLITRPDWCCKPESKYAVHMMTAAKLAKFWEMRLYNKTWRLWKDRPTREERLEVKWE